MSADEFQAVTLPGTLQIVDRERKVLNLSAILVGPGADQLLWAIQSRTSAGRPPEVVSLASAHEPTWSMLSLQIGAVRGWTPFARLYAISDDPRLLATLTTYAPRAQAIVVASVPNRRIDPDVAEAIGRTLHDVASLPILLFAGPELVNKLSCDIGRAPDFFVAPTLDNSGALLKELCRAMLNRIFG